MNQQDIDELTEVFVEESQEIVENLNKEILELEKEVGTSTVNRELLNNIFRYVHTLKGNSGLAGADKLRDLAHKMESLLDRLRKDKIALSPFMVDILFEGIDRISSILQEIISGTDQGIVIDDLVQQLEEVLAGNVPQASEPPSSSPPTEEPQQPPPPSPEPPEPVASQIPPDIHRILTTYEETRLTQNLQHGFRIYEAILNLSMDKFEQIVTEVIHSINTIGEVIAKAPSSKTLPGYDLQVRLIFASLASLDEVTQTVHALPILADQHCALRLLIDSAHPAASPAQPAANQVSPEPSPAPAPEATSAAERPAQSPPPPKDRAPAPTKSAVPKDFSDQSGNTVRVDIKKLDNLMNIVGELVLAKARYMQFESELEGITAYKILYDNLKRNNKVTSKKLEDLREAILQVRMVQIGSLFNRFPRIVRDLAKNHQKQIQLVLEGQETELDKAVVDEMGDPLIHLIRNAVGHGIEDPVTRRQAGKPETGTITLRAYQEGSYIVIEIQDDGAGMHLNRIRNKALEAGLIEKGAKLSDNELLNFIFHPGFSTAKTVTDTSGRGVGMDVVKLTISNLKGIIDIQTTPGVGTKFIVKLPLTLAIIQVLLVKVSHHTYAIPLSSVTESFRLHPEEIEIVDGQEVTQLRHLVLPLFRIKQAFGLDNENHTKPPSTSFVVVIGLAEKKIGLVVDELLEQQEIVIKPLGRYLSQTPGFAGATTLGDGRVVLILDIIGLIEQLNITAKTTLKKPQAPSALRPEDTNS
ncbi:hypothetical protein GF339_01235 [candidate division KSB3 bacterium]|uniref:histidine kinase n=1 Tax=candidate division KSB3 bacterium TaxID=2044937 RepID=A0A9D5Q3Z4_9BACT|nr:hypothetical protein [candidate division KSB3 bacterium]MBD3323174.1 hypothetical protein [candidate division KSB3 bacterium]